MPAPLITPEIIAQIRQGVSEAAAAWQRAFDLGADITVGDTADLLSLVSQDAWNAPGLAIVLSQAAGAYVLLVADASHVFPSWIDAPDATGKSKLATLAQELGMVLLPEALIPMSQQTARVDNVQEALLRTSPAAGIDALPLQIRCSETDLPAILIGCVDAAKLLATAGEPVANVTTATPATPLDPPHAAPQRTMPFQSRMPPLSQEFEDGIPALPSYTRSLLKIQVPVVASLATTQIPVSRILEIGPGSIIQFDCSCEQPLSLAIGEHEFAVGEAVKVGEKFGLRITSMAMPPERFWSVRGRRE